MQSENTDIAFNSVRDAAYVSGYDDGYAAGRASMTSHPLLEKITSGKWCRIHGHDWLKGICKSCSVAWSIRRPDIKQ